MKKAVTLLLVTVLITLLAAGCNAIKGAKDINDSLNDLKDLADELENAGKDEGTVVFTGVLHSFEDAQALLAVFKEFAYVWESNIDGNTEEWSFSYEYLGRENVNGVDTGHFRCVKVEGKTDEFEFWFNDNWNCVKALVNGELKEGMDGEMEGMLLNMLAQVYVNYTVTASSAFSEPGVLTYGYSMVKEGRENVDLGAGRVNMEIYELKSAFTDITLTIGLAEIGGKKMYLLLNSGHDGAVSGLRVTRAIPH